MQYRREIDGLRSLAVIPVILFHAGFDIFSGGYVGVDVFFVISGYLITTLLVDDIEQKKFSLLKFYERRARRILPALFFIMLLCIPFAWMWMLPSQFEDFSKSLVATSFFASNILFGQNKGYFASETAEEPLLHTWSLAVEEQYYVLFPIFLFLVWRYGKNHLFWLMAVLAAASLLLGEWGWRHDPSGIFYLAPARIWEFFAGSLAAFIVRKNGVQNNNTAALLGLVAVIASFVSFDTKTPFPGIYTLLPVAGTVLLIVYANSETWIGRLLANPVPVRLGLVSYSAYLWHQPLFAFTRIRLLEEPAWQLMLCLSAVSFALAGMTWKFIEQPFRSQSTNVWSSKTIAFSALSAMLAFGSYGYWASSSSFFRTLYETNLTPAQMNVFGYLGYADRAEWIENVKLGRCFLYTGADDFALFDKEHCLDLSSNKRNVILIGDSHAAHFASAIRFNFKDANLMQASASGCKPLLPLTGEKRCTQMVDYVFNDILTKANDVHTIILSARWKKADMKKLAKTIEALKSRVDNIVVFGPTVEYIDSLPAILMRLGVRSFEIPSPLVNRYSFEVDERMGLIAESAGAHYESVISILCGRKKDRCISQLDNDVPVAFDYGHFTLQGARFVTQGMTLFGDIPTD
tara:strand:- start:75061 stop:76956 length:1896 start_codon:yes stop_codon:yes gene_type:complete